MEGFKDDTCETKRLAFEALKCDLLQILSPVSKTLQEVSLLTPKVMSMRRKVIRSFDKLLILLDRDGGDAFQRDNIFSTASEILEKLTDEEEEIIPERRTRTAASENPNNDYCQFHGYLLKSNLQDDIESCH